LARDRAVGLRIKLSICVSTWFFPIVLHLFPDPKAIIPKDHADGFHLVNCAAPPINIELPGTVRLKRTYGVKVLTARATLIAVPLK